MKNDYEPDLPDDFDEVIAKEIQKMFTNDFIQSKHKMDKLVSTVVSVDGFKRILPKLKLVDQAAFVIKLIDRLYSERYKEVNLGEEIVHSQEFYDWSKDSYHYICYQLKEK